nr:MAG TPA: hypothetical protein [Caudoviricetes sp.]
MAMKEGDSNVDLIKKHLYFNRILILKVIYVYSI